MLGRLRHPNVVRCLGAVHVQGHFNIFVEWMAGMPNTPPGYACLQVQSAQPLSVSLFALSSLSGGSIDRLLCEFGPFDETVIVKYLKQVVMGVSYLHENRVIHRDLKGTYVVLLLGTSHVHTYVRAFMVVVYCHRVVLISVPVCHGLPST